MRSETPRDELPTVSVVIPMFNEVETIGRCIDSVLNQDYSQKRIEILAVDGLSNDGSREKVLGLSEKFPNIRLLDNLKRTTPEGLNIGIKNSRGDIVIILGAHTRIKNDFIRLNVKYMEEMKVKCVGGTQINVGDTYLQRAIGFVMASPFGITSAPYRYRRKQKFVDTVVYAAYRRELFDEIGYFDEELYISEDAELNWRMRKAGYNIFFTPEIITYYYPRKSFKKLIKQFLKYGMVRVNVVKKHPDAIKFLHLIPSLFLTASFLFLVLGIVKTFIPLMAIWALYILYNLTGCLSICFREGIKYIFILPLIFLSIHLSFGTGFIAGIFKTRK